MAQGLFWHSKTEGIAKSNNSIFRTLPFPIECEGNIFGKPVVQSKLDVSSMTPSQLKKFVEQCEQAYGLSEPKKEIFFQSKNMS